VSRPSSLEWLLVVAFVILFTVASAARFGFFLTQ
jgi:hypothetical protein